MREPIDVFLLLTGVGGAFMALLWGTLYVFMQHTRRLVPTARAGLELADRDPPEDEVCLVIPAHNEEDVIAPLVRSLKRQDHPRLRVVLALDRCTDRTAEIARAEIDGDERFEVFEIDHCPDDWAGKVNAVWQGATASESARGCGVLVFADADTEFHPSCIRATLALRRDRDLGMLSLLSTLTADRWFEKLIQPMTTFELVYQYPLHRANRDRRRRALANGQFMMFTREAYDTIGGHEEVKDTLLEDLALAMLIKEDGFKAGVMLADGMLHCRMYDSWPAFRIGWKRIYTECQRRKVRRLRKCAWRVRLLGSVLPAFVIAGVCTAALGPAPSASWVRWPALTLAPLGLGVSGFVLASIYAMSRSPVWAVPISPWACWKVSGILFEAASDVVKGVPIRWGGREYVRPAR